MRSLCIEKGWKFTTLIEERDIAYFPAVQNGHEATSLGWLGSGVKWFVATALLSTLPPCGSNSIFWTWRWTSLDQDHVDHDLCRSSWKISFHTVSYDSSTIYRRLSEQHLGGNRGRFAAEEDCVSYISATC